MNQCPDAVQPGERFQGQLGAVEPFFPQASARPEALQSGRDAEGDGIKWLGHLSFLPVVATPRMIITDSLSDKRRIRMRDNCLDWVRV